MVTTIRSVLGAAAAVAALVATPVLAADKFDLDKTHAAVVFTVSHLGLSKTWGWFRDIDGDLMLDRDSIPASSVTLTMQAASIDTNHDKRDDHLRNADFFNAKEFPQITFKSTEIKQTSTRTADIIGDMTMLGVTRPVTLHATLNHIGDHPRDKSMEAAGFSATGQIRRSDFGMTYAVPFVGDAITIFIDLEWLRKK